MWAYDRDGCVGGKSGFHLGIKVGSLDEAAVGTGCDWRRPEAPGWAFLAKGAACSLHSSLPPSVTWCVTLCKARPSLVSTCLWVGWRYIFMPQRSGEIRDTNVSHVLYQRHHRSHPGETCPTHRLAKGLAALFFGALGKRGAAGERGTL